jgi:hypothetical protein
LATGGARRGRRDNGLDAAEYAAVADVDPRVGEHLLDVLAAGGIAAYLQPASDLNPVTRTTTIPARPTDRLYVDRRHVQTARHYLDRLADGDDDAAGDDASAHNDAPAHDDAPTRDEASARDDTPARRPPGARATAAEPATPDIEAEWARLVAGFHEEVDPAARTWPAAEQVDFPAGEPTSATTGRARPPEAPGRPTAPRDPDPDEPSLLDGLDTFGADLPDEPDDDDRYTPPPPPPLPRISKYAVAGILGVVGGFVLFLFPTLLPFDSGISMLLGFAAIIAGFVTLIWRLRPGDSDEDADPDDGAVV